MSPSKSLLCRLPCSRLAGRGRMAWKRREHSPLLRFTFSRHRPSDQPHQRDHCSQTDDLDHGAPPASGEQADEACPPVCYAAWREPAFACMPVSVAPPTCSFVRFGGLVRPEYAMSIHRNNVPTIANSPATIPQYTPDIGHSLAVVSRESSCATA